MSNTKTGGSAFPIGIDAFAEDKEGMTLRDYFAAKAMQGLMAADTDFNLPPDVVARDAYDTADAMLKAREG